MNKIKILPDDPRLTTYALGEIDAGDLAEFEAALRADPAAQSALAEIRIAADQLFAALAEETAEAKVERQGVESIARRRGSRLAQFALGGLAAACLVAFVVLERARLTVRKSAMILIPSAATASAEANRPVIKDPVTTLRIAPQASATSIAKVDFSADQFLTDRTRDWRFDPSKSLLYQTDPSKPSGTQSFGAVLIKGEAISLGENFEPAVDGWTVPIDDLAPAFGDRSATHGSF